MEDQNTKLLKVSVHRQHLSERPLNGSDDH